MVLNYPISIAERIERLKKVKNLGEQMLEAMDQTLIYDEEWDDIDSPHNIKILLNYHLIQLECFINALADD